MSPLTPCTALGRLFLGCFVVVVTIQSPNGLWASSPAPRSSQFGSETTHRFAVIVANNHGQDNRTVLRYSERDARKVRTVLNQLGDFPKKNLFLLVGASASDVWRTIRHLDQRIAKLKRAGARSLLVFYYSGHAEGQALELGKSTLRFDKLSNFLKKSSATVRLAFLDSCQSGNLIAGKGAKRGPAFTLRVRNQMRSSGYAMMTSSASDELSQESAEIRGSFFTHFLVSGLRGAADETGDGRVTLAEAYRYAYGRTVAKTSAHIGGGQHPMYEFRLRGRGEVVLTSINRGRSGLTVTSAENGRLLILDSKKSSMIAEAQLATDQKATIALPAGRYVAYLVAPGATYRRMVRVKAGSFTKIDQNRDFDRYALKQAVPKGGLFRPIWTSRLAASALLRRFPLGGQLLSYGTGLHYSLVSPERWHVGARLAITSAPAEGASRGFSTIGALASAGHDWLMGPLILRGQALAGYEYMSQSTIGAENRSSSGLLYLGSVALAYPFGQLEAHINAEAGGRVFRLRDEGTTHRMDLQLLFGAAWTWLH